MVNQLALPLVAILVLHSSTFQVGLLLAFQSSAFLIVGLPAGAWVDRMRSRSVLILNNVLRAVGVGSIPAAAIVHLLSMSQLYVVALVVGVSTVFFDVAYQSYLPELVGRGALVEGNARLQASESIAQVVGPGIGGLLVQALSAPYALIVDALSFLWSATWITAIRSPAPEPERRPDRHLGREITEGLRFVLGNRLLRAIAMCTATGNLFTAIAFSAYYVLLARELQLSPGLIGLITSSSAVGGVLGSLAAKRIAARLGQGPTIWIVVLAGAPTGFVAPFVHKDWTIALLGLAQMVFWGRVVVYNVAQVSFRQGLCPPELLGRMNATMRFLVWGTLPVGDVLGGLLGSTLGVRPTLFIAAVGGCLPFLPTFFSPLRKMRELPTYETGRMRR